MLGAGGAQSGAGLPGPALLLPASVSPRGRGMGCPQELGEGLAGVGQGLLLDEGGYSPFLTPLRLLTLCHHHDKVIHKPQPAAC